jgi:hypothetical protein
VLRWLEGYRAFSKANRALSSICSPKLHMEPSVYALIILILLVIIIIIIVAIIIRIIIIIIAMKGPSYP